MKKSSSLLFLIAGLFLLSFSSCTKNNDEIKNPSDTGMNDLYMYDVINKTNKQLTHTSDTVEFISTFFHHRQAFLYLTMNGIYSMNVDGSGRAGIVSLYTFSDISSDDQTIIYGNSGDIWMANPDGSNPRKLTHGEINCWRAKWSPDRQKIACIDTDGNLYLVTLDGTVKLIINRMVQEFNWSPNSKTLAYNKSLASSTIIYKYDLITQVETQLTPSAQLAYSPVFNPVNGKICFVSPFYKATEAGCDLMIMNADGSGQQSILRRDVNQPCWSPDGTRIAFKLDGNVAICNADGTGLQVINDKEGHCYVPLWSPDGKHILYSRMMADK